MADIRYLHIRQSGYRCEICQERTTPKRVDLGSDGHYVALVHQGNQFLYDHDPKPGSLS